MSDFAKIKTGTCPKVGQIGEPFSEPTKMDWIVMAADRKSGIVSALFHKKLWYWCTGIESHYKHDDYNRQLKRDEEGWYETR